MHDFHALDWSDHRYALACGPEVSKLTAANLDTCDLYWEQEGGETGVVFFTDLGVARRFLRLRGLVGYRVVGLPDPKFAVEASIHRLRCNVAYRFRLVKGVFVRDVTEFHERKD
jgi:hypothetical protein